MKRFVSVLFSLCIAFSLCCYVSAADIDLTQAPDFYDTDRLERIHELQAEVQAMLEDRERQMQSRSSRVVYPIITQASLDVPLRQQQNRFYCGPASVEMVLEYLNFSVTQSELADSMSTTYDDGTIVYQITNCLNSYLGSRTYSHIHTSEISFIDGMQSSLDDDYPVVCHVMTDSLPIYGDRRSGHYVVATGYYWVYGTPNYTADVETITYNDPHYDNRFYGTHECTFDEMSSAVNANAGFYIMG